MASARRSCLVVPGHVERMHRRAQATPADEIVFDLEDAVAPEAKDLARELVERTLSEPAWAARQVSIRVNAHGTKQIEDDLAVCAGLGRPNFTIVLPKVERADDIRWVASRVGDVPVQALIETPAGVMCCREVAALQPVASLILGYADLAAALGRRGAEHNPERWLVAQEAVLAAARAAEIQAIDGPFLRLGDLGALRVAGEFTRDLGFDGKWAIHPEQVQLLNHLFSATDAELDWAGRVRAAIEEAAARGGAAVRLDGSMVDEAMVRHAGRLLGLPRQPGANHELPKAHPGSRLRRVAAPDAENLTEGRVFESPGLTLGEGHAALHQSVVGDRLRLALDASICSEVTGLEAPIAHPVLVCNVAIGQSTGPSGGALGGFSCQDLRCRPVPIGTTLRTRTTVTSRRLDAEKRAVVALRVSTTDERGEQVVDFSRCVFLSAVRPGDGSVDHHQSIQDETDARVLVPSTWNMEPMRVNALGPLFADLSEGAIWEVAGTEPITSAPELARLTLNVAGTRLDATAGPHSRRVVSAGHVIGVAAAHVMRVLPDLATILAWRSCEQRGLALEGDFLRTTIELQRKERLADGGLVSLRVAARAAGQDAANTRDVLDWRLVGLMP